MTTIELKPIERQYANNGQHAEQVLRFTLTGEILKADNKPAEQGGDIFDIQIKSARATICKGTDLDAYLALDAAQRYAYVGSDFKIAYLMSKQEWREFCKEFGTVTRESAKNGGLAKIRLKSESSAMMNWLSTH